MIIEPFAFGDSAVHRLDPRLRVVLATAYSVVVAVADRMPVLVCALGISLILAGLARLDPVAAGKRLLAVSGFLLLLWLVLPLTTEGDPVFAYGPLKASRDGIDLASRICLKSIAIVLAFMALIATMTIAALGHALNRPAPAGQAGLFAPHGLSLHLRHRPGIPTALPGRPHPGVQTENEPSYIQNLRLPDRHAFCPGHGPGREGLTGHAVPGV